MIIKKDEQEEKTYEIQKVPTSKRKSHKVEFRFIEEVSSKFIIKSTAKETPPAIENKCLLLPKVRMLFPKGIS